MAVDTLPSQSVISMEANADLTASQYRFVRWVPGEDGISRCGAGLKADGVLQNAPANGGVGAVAVGSCKSKVVAGAAITIGTLVASDAQGRAVPNTVYAGEVILGRALEASGAAGEIITIEYFGSGGAGTD